MRADEGSLGTAAELLAAAERPMIFAGGGLRPSVAPDLQVVAEAMGGPVYLNGAARGSLPFGHPLLGNRARQAAFRGADLVLALGVDWDFRTGYGSSIDTSAKVIQIDADATKVGWNREADLGVTADPGNFLGGLAALADRFATSSGRQWTKEIMELEAGAADAAAATASSHSSPVPSASKSA